MAELKRGTTIEGIEAFGLPVGINLFFLGDYSTHRMTGFYIMDGSSNPYLIQDLKDTFILGATVSDVNTTVGGNYRYIYDYELPHHGHKVNHSHSYSGYTNYGTHQHTYYDARLWADVDGEDCTALLGSLVNGNTADASHTHSITIPAQAYSGIGNNNIYDPSTLTERAYVPFDRRPAFRRLMILRRCV